MNEATPQRQSRRIVVALDASSYSLAALRAAAEVAALLDVDLEGLFIEDINILRLCGYPFTQEIGSYTGASRHLENAAVERQLRTLAAVIQQAMSQVALKTPVRWSLQVRRGPVIDELLAAAQDADLMSLGRSGQGRRNTLGSTASALVQKSQRPLLLLGKDGALVDPLTAVYTGSTTSQRALQWLATLTQYNPRPVRVILVVRPDMPRAIPELEAEARAILGDLPVEFFTVRYGNVLMTLHAHNGGTLVLPNEYTALVAEHPGPIILVP
ncbi:MAG: universal stress protein [Caldilineaceae bacterium]|nr:universal stress protein [Caldilineaceae bacterium]